MIRFETPLSKTQSKDEQSKYNKRIFLNLFRYYFKNQLKNFIGNSFIQEKFLNYHENDF